MVLTPAFWKIAQVISGLWLQRRAALHERQVSQGFALNYVEGIKLVRTATWVVVGLAFLIIVLAASLGLLIHGLLVLQAVSPENLAWLEIIVGGILLVSVAFGVWRLMSDGVWIRFFRIDELVKDVPNQERQPREV